MTTRPQLSDPAWPIPPWRRKLAGLRALGRLSLATLPEHLASLYRDRPAFFLDRPLDYPFLRGACVTHEDLARFTARAAHGLRALGVGPGERVGLLTRNRIELVFVQLAARKLGAAVVPFNALLRREELRHLVADSDVRTLVADRGAFTECLGETRLLRGVDRWVLVTDAVPPPGMHRFADLVADQPEEFDAPPRPADELAFVFYTAGTTGRPKGAMLSDANVLFALRQTARLSALLPTPQRNLALLVMPLAHTSGHQAMLLQLTMGTPMLLHSRFEAGAVLDAIERNRVTQLSGVPTVYRLLLEAGAAERDWRSVELLAWGGDAMPADLIDTFTRIVERARGRAPRWVSGYGLAETSGQLTRVIRGAAVPGAAGRPLPGVRVRVLDPDGRPVRRGDVGELWVRTPGLMQGYLGDPDATSAAIRDGWFRTGDLVRQGRFGRLVLQSRVKEMIKVGGYSVFPAEVERALLAHPDVEQVAVVGVPDTRKGALPAAAVVRRAGSALDEAELVAWAREAIAPYKAPRHVLFVDSIPLSSALKPRRAEVRERVLRLLATREDAETRSAAAH